MIPAPPLSSFQLGPLTVHLYGIIIASAIIICYSLALKLAKSKEISEHYIEKYLLISLPAAIIGARAYHVATNWEYYKNNIAQTIALWNGGLGIYGAIAVTLVTLFFLAKKYNHDWKILADIFAVVVPLGQAIGRWGNYFNQELFGTPTSQPWGLYVDTAYRPQEFASQTTFHPTFLYESILNLINFSILYFVYTKKKYPPGTITSMYLILYGITRFIVDIVKIDPDAHINAGVLSVGQWVSLTSIGIGILGILYFHSKIRQNKVL